MTPSNRNRLYKIIVLLALMTVVATFAYTYWKRLEDSTYALTLSLGKGRGFTIYNPSYNTLPEILQESVRVHEEKHLEDGTIAVWHGEDLESAALQTELAHIKRRKEQIATILQSHRCVSGNLVLVPGSCSGTGPRKYILREEVVRCFVADYICLQYFESDVNTRLKQLQCLSTGD